MNKTIGTSVQLERNWQANVQRSQFRLSLEKYGRSTKLVWSSCCYRETVDKFNVIFELSSNEVLNFKKMMDFKEVESFEFIIVDKTYGMLKIQFADESENYFSTSMLNSNHISRMVIRLEIKNSESIYFILKAVPEQMELYTVGHIETSWEHDIDTLQLLRMMSCITNTQTSEENRDE